MTGHKIWFWIVPLLLSGLFIRSHHLTALPVYTDEALHIKRAAVVYEFHQHPAVESNGKFLFYFLLGIFDLQEKHSALWLGRTTVALTSLLTAACTFRLGRLLGGKAAGGIALVFYVLVPFAVFFERTALADPFAGLMGTMLIWQSLRFARRPSGLGAIGVGVFIALTLAAKLTLAFLAFFPLAAVLILTPYTSIPDLLRRYTRFGVQAMLVVMVLWSLVLIPALIANLTGGQEYVIYPTHLVETTAASQTFFQKIADLWEKMNLLTWRPVTLILLILTPIALLKRPRQVGLTLAWLFLVAVPAFFILDRHSFQSRYLMSGVPALAVLLGLVMTTRYGFLFTSPPNPLSPHGEGESIGWRKPLSLWRGVGVRSRRYIPSLQMICVIGFLVIWAGAFALPFAQDAASDPVKLAMPRLDRQNYFEGYYNGYALLDALEFLRAEGIRRDGDKVDMILATRFCLPDFYRFAEDIRYICNKHFDLPQVEVAYLDPYRKDFNGLLPLYLITDLPTQPPFASNIGADPIRVFRKPYGEIQITVWQFYALE